MVPRNRTAVPFWGTNHSNFQAICPPKTGLAVLKGFNNLWDSETATKAMADNSGVGQPLNRVRAA